jgi:hypothetical protein
MRSGCDVLEEFMGVWPAVSREYPALVSPEGALVSVHVSVEPWLLEEVLEALARVPFPINPEIFHGDPIRVVFPAYEPRLEQVRDALAACGFDRKSVQIQKRFQPGPSDIISEA